MIVFISNSGEILPVAYRIQKEGKEVLVYIHNPRYRGNYNEALERTTASKLQAAVRRAEMVVFDIIRPNEGTHADIQLLKVFRANKNAPEVFGAIADKIRKKVPVVGASSETATWELDRYKGEKIAKSVGIAIPETYQFNKLSEGSSFLKGKKTRWVFKPNNNQDLDLTYVEKFPGDLKSKLDGEYQRRLEDKFDYILQKVIEGVEISTEGWFDGEKFVSFNHTLEDKKLMTGGLGPAIGSQGNTVWIKYDANGLLVREMSKLSSQLKKAGYVGPVDANCIISEQDKKPYFLEWTMRPGYDALYCLLTLYAGKISKFFEGYFKPNFHEGYASSQRITIPPFPYSEPSLLRDYAQGVEVMSGLDHPGFWAEDVAVNEGRLECAGADGILGVIASRGKSIGASVGNMYRSIDKLKVGSTLQYRTDSIKRPERDIKKLQKWGARID